MAVMDQGEGVVKVPVDTSSSSTAPTHTLHLGQGQIKASLGVELVIRAIDEATPSEVRYPQ